MRHLEAALYSMPSGSGSTQAPRRTVIGRLSAAASLDPRVKLEHDGQRTTRETRIVTEVTLKSLFRMPAVQGVLARLLSGYLNLALRTTRWRFENRAPVDARVASPDGFVACFWHGRIPLGPACRTVLQNKPRKVIMSLSPDGEFVTRAMERLSFPAIRGSSSRGSERTDGKGGAAAVREALRFLRGGGVIAITPDGPRGPAQVMAAGAVTLARASGAQVYLFGLSCRPDFRLKSWDRTQFPLPFGRGAVVFDGPLYATRDDDVEAVRLDWQARLVAAQARAEALTG